MYSFQRHLFLDLQRLGLKSCCKWLWRYFLTGPSFQICTSCEPAANTQDTNWSGTRQAGAEKQDLPNMLLLLLSFSLSLASAQRLTDAEELAFKDNVEDLCRGRYENLLAGKIHKRATLLLSSSHYGLFLKGFICRPPILQYFLNRFICRPPILQYLLKKLFADLRLNTSVWQLSATAGMWSDVTGEWHPSSKILIVFVFVFVFVLVLVFVFVFVHVIVFVVSQYQCLDIF